MTSEVADRARLLQEPDVCFDEAYELPGANQVSRMRTPAWRVAAGMAAATLGVAAAGFAAATWMPSTVSKGGKVLGTGGIISEFGEQAVPTYNPWTGPGVIEPIAAARSMQDEAPVPEPSVATPAVAAVPEAPVPPVAAPEVPAAAPVAPPAAPAAPAVQTPPEAPPAVEPVPVAPEVAATATADAAASEAPAAASETAAAQEAAAVEAEASSAGKKEDVEEVSEKAEKDKVHDGDKGAEEEEEAKPKESEKTHTSKKDKAEAKEKAKEEKPKQKKKVCKMAEKDDDCYKSVVWAMTEGIKTHPEWYTNLTKKSLFEDFQAHLALEPNVTKCHWKPCKAGPNCKTATRESACYSGVKWDMTEGIYSHQDWYPGLSEDSSFEDFQRHTHSNNRTLCPTAPCNPQPFKPLTLFCWMAVQVDGYEVGLATAQNDKKVGIFACDDYVTVSTKDLGIDGVQTLIISNMQVGGYTDGGTSPNAPIFVEAWNKIQEDGRWQDNAWTVKADPDAVVIPKRLRNMLLPDQQPENPYPPPYKADPSRGQFVANCDKMAGWGKGWGDGWPMMYGSLEVISQAAMKTYYDHRDECQGPDGQGEDAYMGLCLRQLKVGELFIRQGDNVCAGGACTDQSFASYHPYKDPGLWFDCYGQATR